jgi:aminoglycoside phosphotransferase (APT) family kinase protein
MGAPLTESTPPQTPGRLAEFLSKVTGGQADVLSLTPLAGGASREMFAVDVDVRGGGEPGIYTLVLRKDMGGRIYEQALSRAEEFRVILAARAAGVRVPRARWVCEDERVLGAPFFLQDREQGETVGRRIVKDPELASARAALPAQMAEELAKIHAIDPSALGFLPRPPEGRSVAAHSVGRLRAELDRFGEPHPALELALAWAIDEAPRWADVPPTFVHGDYRIGNVMVVRTGLAFVLDWEFARVGDPVEDLAWPLVRSWRFGADAREMGGVGDRAPYLAAYAKASGRDVDEDHVRFWEVLGTVSWAVGCIAQANRHLSGQAPSVELASLGRKTAEMELDVLDLLEVARRPSGAKKGT